ncbi:MAG: rhodanese-like domain-containing protein [Planctomycetota bacterium]
MTVKRIDPERAKELLESNQGFVYLDVRFEEEFKEGHIPTAKHLPVLLRGAGGIGMDVNESFVETMEKHFQKNDKIIIGCRKGGRSLKASKMLVKNGFTNIYDMRGGFLGETDALGNITFAGWSERGLPVTQEYTPTDQLK